MIKSLFKTILNRYSALLCFLFLGLGAAAQTCQTINVAVASTNPAGMGGSGNPIRVCQNANVNIVATATFSGSSAGALYIWTYGDASAPDTTNSLIANHTYTEGGVFIVDLIVVDPQGCRNGNRLGQVVQVSTTPLFTGTQPNADTICANETTMIHGEATPVPGIYNCAPPIAAVTFIPDVQTQAYTTSINVECFAFGATLTNVNQLQSICLNMEHSFLGDLQMKIICPNNQETILKEYPGGGGTFLGEPNDPGPGDMIPGIGYDYCFANSAAWGTMVASIATNTVAVTGMAPGTPGNALISGTYTSSQSFNNLIGCPLNGNWTIHVLDNLGADNGYIFSWGINFDPALLPGSYSFTPTFPVKAWNPSADIVSTANSGQDIFVKPASGGQKCYTYKVTDNFGCTYDTTVCLFVVDPGNPGKDTSINVCLNFGVLNVFNFLAGTPQSGGVWTGTGVDALGNFNPATAGVGVFDLVYTKSNGNCDTTATLSVHVVNDVVMDFDFILKKACDQDTVQFVNLSEPGTYVWNYGDGTFPLDTLFSPTHIYQTQAVYPVTLKVRNNNGCVDSITKIVDITHPLDAVFSKSADTICLNAGVPVDFTDASVGALHWNWSFGEGSPATTQNPSYVFTQSGYHTIRLVISDDIPCYDTAIQYVQVDAVPYFDVAQDRYAICAGEGIVLEPHFLQSTIRSINWNFGDGAIWNETGTTSHKYETPGLYWINADADFGACGISHSTDSVVVNAYPKVNLGPDSVLCLDGPAITVSALDNASDPGISWLWNTGATTPSIDIVHPGTYSLTASKNDCATTENIEVNKDCYTDIPNAFTPNGDGVNDYFYPRELLSKGVVSFSMTVFDRWGQKIFESTNPNGRGWDGKFNDKNQPMGAYIYQIKAVLKNGRTEDYTGNLTLVR